MTIQDRINRAHERAAQRFSLAYAITSGAEAIPFSAIKKITSSDEIGPGAITTRRAELILTRVEFDLITARIANLKNATITEINCNGATNDWKVDAREPFVENDPVGATVRIFIYQRTTAQ